MRFPYYFSEKGDWSKKENTMRHLTMSHILVAMVGGLLIGLVASSVSL